MKAGAEQTTDVMLKFSN